MALFVERKGDTKLPQLVLGGLRKGVQIDGTNIFEDSNHVIANER